VLTSPALAVPFGAGEKPAAWNRLGCIVVVDDRTFGDGTGETLAIPLLMGDERPGMVWAQRSIDREWSTPNDPNHPKPVPGMRSEATAVGLSAVVPGAGQLYTGANSGYLFLLAEAAGWVSLVVLRNDGDDLRNQASDIAGTPTSAQSGWSSERWAAATGEDPHAIEALYRADPESYYTAIGGDSRYAAGWSSSSEQDHFVDLRGQSDKRFRQSRGAGAFLWLNHLAGAADALRAARIHNLPLRQNLGLKATGGWRKGGPVARVSLEGKF
jgi:hypothetical protein